MFNKEKNEFLISNISKKTLHYLLLKISNICDCEFNSDDWDAVFFGVDNCFCSENNWFEYQFSCVEPLIFYVCLKHDQDLYSIKFSSVAHEKELFYKIDSFVQILKEFEQGEESLEKFIINIFDNIVYPGDRNIIGCTDEHFTECSECRECYHFFKGKKWLEILDNAELPVGTAGLSFLSKRARLYFYPAYLLKSLRTMDSLYIADALNDGEANKYDTLQKETISFIKELTYGYPIRYVSK